MKHNWEKSLEVILHHEGGYVNHPKDPGGETNMGVTKRVYEDFGGTKDMKELTREDVEPIYKKNYWDRVKGDDLPDGLDLMIFDFAVNAGTGRAAKFIQRLVNTTVDGHSRSWAPLNRTRQQRDTTFSAEPYHKGFSSQRRRHLLRPRHLGKADALPAFPAR